MLYKALQVYLKSEDDESRNRSKANDALLAAIEGNKRADALFAYINSDELYPPSDIPRNPLLAWAELYNMAGVVVTNTTKIVSVAISKKRVTNPTPAPGSTPVDAAALQQSSFQELIGIATLLKEKADSGTLSVGDFSTGPLEMETPPPPLVVLSRGNEDSGATSEEQILEFVLEKSFFQRAKAHKGFHVRFNGECTCQDGGNFVRFDTPASVLEERLEALDDDRLQARPIVDDGPLE